MCSHKYYPSDNSRKRAPRAPLRFQVQAITRAAYIRVHSNLLFTHRDLDVRFTITTRRQKFFRRSVDGTDTVPLKITWSHVRRAMYRDAREMRFLPRHRLLKKKNNACITHRSLWPKSPCNTHVYRTSSEIGVCPTCVSVRSRFNETRAASRGTGHSVSPRVCRDK